MANLSEKQRWADAAFRGGYISLGKLAEEIEMNVRDARKWLVEHDIAQNNSYLEDDVTYA